MTARVVLSCDGHRHGQPCRAWYPTRTRHAPTGIGESWRAGWRNGYDTGGQLIDLCPSPGHDEDGDA